MRRLAPGFVVFLLVAATLASPLPGREAQAMTGTAGPLGVFRGSGRPELVAEYEQWLGAPVGSVLDFVGAAGDGDPWATIDDPGWWCGKWAARPAQLVLSVSMLPSSAFTLNGGASGDYDGHWARFGQTLVDRGCASAVLRLGWEFNGRFYPWAAGGQEATFAAYWRRIVTVLRSVPGQRFRFDWSPLAGNANADVEAAWPGDDVVDVVGLDAYDTSVVPPTDPVARWRDQVERPYGLAWQLAFAGAHGKPVSLPEWGLAVRPNDNLGGGDNPYYIEQMWAWVNSHDYLYANYFEVDARDGAHRLMTDRFPNASARYRALVRAPAPAPALPPSGSRAPVAVASPQPSPPSPPSSAPPATPATTAPVAPAPAPETGVPRRAVTALPSVDPGVAAAVRTPLETADPWKDATAACAALLVAAVATAHAGAARRRARCPKPGQVAPAR